MTSAVTLRVPASRKLLADIRNFVKLQAADVFAGPDEIDDLIQAVDEAATNIIVHGYQDGSGEIDVIFQYQPGKILIVLRDQAPRFDPTHVPEPDIHLPLEQRPVGGLGVYLIRKCVDEFTYQPLNGSGNQLTLVKYLANKE
jgi:serine/threonine-protein kinase RsbW